MTKQIIKETNKPPESMNLSRGRSMPIATLSILKATNLAATIPEKTALPFPLFYKTS